MSIKELWIYLLSYHRGKTYGGIIGVVLGLLIVLLGWKLLVLLFFALIGLILGKSIDDGTDPRDFFKRLFRE